MWASPERLDAVYAAVDGAAKATPTDTFEPAGLADRVGRDYEALFHWVRDNTYWVPYRGALRGARGVLMDRLGNSLDRSLLLAELLRVSGQQVRLAHASLAEVQARALVEQVQPLPVEAPAARAGRSPSKGVTLEQHARDYALDEDLLIRVATDAARASAALSSELGRRVPDQAQFLSSVVGAKSESAGPDRMAAMGDHWWVQRFDGTAWVDLDTLLPNAQAGTPIVPAGVTYPYNSVDGTVPLGDEFLHAVGMRVVIQQWRAGELTTKTALEHRLRTAEVIGQAIRITHVPLQWPSELPLGGQDGGMSFVSTVKAQREWLPVLTVGSRTFVRFSFTDAGDLIEYPKGREDARAGSRALQESFDALSGGAEPDPGGSDGAELAAAWIEYDIAVTGEETRTIRRELFDLSRSPSGSAGLRNPAETEQARTARAFGLLGEVQLLPMGARFTPQFVELQVLHGAVRNRKVLSGLLREIDTADSKALQARLRAFEPVPDMLLALAFARFDKSPVGHDVYLDRPNLLTYRTTLSVRDQRHVLLRQGFDIVANEVAVRPGATVPGFHARLMQGAADTNLEALLVGGDPASPATMLEARAARGTAWVVIRGVNDPAWRAAGWPSDARRGPEEALRAGYLVVVPNLSAGRVAEASWWRVHPATGDTVGIGPQGWGQAMKETVLLGALAVTFAFLVGFSFGFILCMFAKDAAYMGGLSHPVDLKECLCAGLASGAILGSAVAGALAATASGGAALAASSLLRGWFIGMGGGLALAAMVKEGLCVSPRQGAHHVGEPPLLWGLPACA